MGEFFDELDLPSPQYFPVQSDTSSRKSVNQHAHFVEQALIKERPDVVVVYGDVTSSLAGAMAASKLSIPVAHIEAGVHTDFHENPEEINRRSVEKMADVLFAHTRHAHASLLSAGFSKDSVFLTGDIMKDTLMSICERDALTVSKDDYILVTTHRAENTDHADRLTNICEALCKCERNILFPVHPRTEKSLKAYGLWESLEVHDKITLLPPQSYTETIKLICGADKVVSDSGGLRREAYILGKPVISLIEMNWVPEMVDAGWERIVGANSQDIIEAIQHFAPPHEQPDIFGDGKAAERILAILQDRYDETAFAPNPYQKATAPAPLPQSLEP